MQALQRLALAGDELDGVTSAALAGGSHDDALARLDRALAAGVLDVAEGRLRFRHALVAQALLDGLAPHRRAVLHAQIARPYAEVISFADALAREAQRLGAARGHAFAVTLRGEALSLQRLSELALHRGRWHEAKALLADALDVAQQSDVGFHLLDRIYGTRIAMARNPDAALAALEEADTSVRGPLETCPGCRITFAVPATIAAARGRQLTLATAHQRQAQYLADVVMKLPAWYAALHEARAHVAMASGEAQASREAFAEAARGFASAGQPLDAARCGHLAAQGPPG